MGDVKTNNLFSAMETHYVDKDGKTVQEAVQLGMSLLKFFDSLGKVKRVLYDDQSDKAGYFDDFALSLVSENFDLDVLQNNRHVINGLLAVLEGYNKTASQTMREVVYSDFMDILNNPIIKNPVCKIPIQLIFMEGLMRWINSYIFAGSQNYTDINVSHANYQCSMHVLSFIAFMCNEDVANYFNMNLEVEIFMNESAKKVLGK